VGSSQGLRFGCQPFSDLRLRAAAGIHDSTLPSQDSQGQEAAARVLRDLNVFRSLRRSGALALDHPDRHLLCGVGNDSYRMVADSVPS
jgi:hypothetical protein